MSDGAIRHASPHPPVERSNHCGGCRLQRELDELRSVVRQTAHMGLCSQTHHEHLMYAAQAVVGK